MNDSGSSVTLTRLVNIIRHSWLLIAATTVIGFTLAFVVSTTTPPTYQSSASMYFSIRQGNTGSELNQGSAYTQAQMLSFATLATASITLNDVIDEIDLDITSKDLARNIKVSIPQNTVILDIQVTSRSAERSADIANAIAASLSDVVVDLAPTTVSRAPTVSAAVIEPAVAPNVQSAPSTPRESVLGAILGLLLGTVASVLFALLETRIRSADIVATVTSLPVIGQIGRFPRSSDVRPIVMRNRNGEEAESFRRVRTALRFASVDADVRAILVTSAVPAEGKTTVAINLALVLAETGSRVLLIDADLRRPRVADALGVEGAIGLTTVLVGEVDLVDALASYGPTNLDLLLAGDVPPNPAELLSSAKMAQVLTDLTDAYDLVVIDSAPVLSVADATLLAPHADVLLLVVDASKTRRAQLARTLQVLSVAGALVSGIVLNRVKIRKRKDAYYYDLTTSAEPFRLSAALARLTGSRPAETRRLPSPETADVIGSTSAAAANAQSDRSSQTESAIAVAVAVAVENVGQADEDLVVKNLDGTVALALAEDVTPDGLTDEGPRSGQPAKQGKSSH